MSTVPEGFQLVPKKDTAEMRAAAWDVFHLSSYEFSRVWAAMLAAAPSPPTDAQGMPEIGKLVSKTGGDYTFTGDIRAVFTKRNGVVRYVVENDDRVLHIFSAANLSLPTPPGRAPDVVTTWQRSDWRQIVARGYCHPPNSHKELDSDLLEAIVEEITKAAAAPPVEQGRT